METFISTSTASYSDLQGLPDLFSAAFKGVIREAVATRSPPGRLQRAGDHWHWAKHARNRFGYLCSAAADALSHDRCTNTQRAVTDDAFVRIIRKERILSSIQALVQAMPPLGVSFMARHPGLKPGLVASIPMFVAWAVFSYDRP
jgi:hypothetical protein